MLRHNQRTLARHTGWRHRRSPDAETAYVQSAWVDGMPEENRSLHDAAGAPHPPRLSERGARIMIEIDLHVAPRAMAQSWTIGPLSWAW